MFLLSFKLASFSFKALFVYKFRLSWQYLAKSSDTIISVFLAFFLFDFGFQYWLIAEWPMTPAVYFYFFLSPENNFSYYELDFLKSLSRDIFSTLLFPLFSKYATYWYLESSYWIEGSTSFLFGFNHFYFKAYPIILLQNFWSLKFPD